jgi:predicted oxidoreductase
MKRSITRRQFVKTISAGAGTVLLAQSAFAYSNVAPEPYAFRQVTLGRTGIKTTFLGMGTGFSGYNRSSNITRKGVAESLIRNAYEKGIRFFDCADSYGTHPFAASALKAVPRDSFTLGTKIWLTKGGIPEAERPN